jgi:hypothetical protein
MPGFEFAVPLESCLNFGCVNAKLRARVAAQPLCPARRPIKPYKTA